MLVDWDPRHLYRTLIADEAAMEHFLAHVCTMDWNLEQDRGRSWSEATALLAARHPEHAALIDAYDTRWSEMLRGELVDTVAILRALHASGTRLYALTNWSAEKFPEARRRFAFLDLFDGILVSGEEGVVKPDPAIYRLLMSRHGLDAASLVFIDDNAKNAEAATALGIHGIHFVGAPALARELSRLGLLPAPATEGII